MKTILLSLILLYNLSALAVSQEKYPHMPNPKLTPGNVLNVTRDDVCKSGYKSSFPAISVSMKSQVFARYSTDTTKTGYNVDHLVPIGLGGSNSITNLWPQPLSGEWNHHRKNRLEDSLRKMVCQGVLDLKQAQQEIAADWVSAYKKYMGEIGKEAPAQSRWKKKTGT